MKTTIHYFLYFSEFKDVDVINLLLFSNELEQHYCLIRNFSRFMAYRIKYNGVQSYYFKCLHGVIVLRKDLLTKHVEFCKKRFCAQNWKTEGVRFNPRSPVPT